LGYFFDEAMRRVDREGIFVYPVTGKFPEGLAGVFQ
jgi:hypothetical protein